MRPARMTFRSVRLRNRTFTVRGRRLNCLPIFNEQLPPIRCALYIPLGSFRERVAICERPSERGSGSPNSLQLEHSAAAAGTAAAVDCCSI
jgi:hypothetical protein